MVKLPVSINLRQVAGVNFLSTATPAYYCTLAALLVYNRSPWFERQALHVLWNSALFTLPLLFFTIFVHYLLTRFSSRNVLVFSRFGEVLAALAAAITTLVAGDIWIINPAILSGIAYSFYRPAMKFYLAQTVPKEALARSFGYITATTFGGISTGIITAALIVNIGLYYNCSIAPAAFLPLVTSLLTWQLSQQFDPTVPECPRLHFSELPKRCMASFKDQPRYRELLLTGLGECYLSASIILVASMAIQYLDFHFNPDFRTQLNQYLVLFSPVLGVTAGALFGGWKAHKNVEIGLVPPAIIILVVSASGVGFLPLLLDSHLENGLLPTGLFIFGGAVGITLPQLQSYQAYFVKDPLRAAYFSWFHLPFGFGILTGIGLSSLMYLYRVGIFSVAIALAGLTAIMAGITFFFMPQFLFRCGMLLLLRIFYRLRIFNGERIPETGPALLVANRASFVDMLFITACTSRPVRFMMHESYFRYPWLSPWFRSLGFLEVPVGKPKRLRQLYENTRELLRRGELICVFPEEDITRNGTMSGFKNGMHELLPEDSSQNIPVIPLRIGLTWGSIFSCYYGKFTLRWPDELPHPASITVGEPLPPEANAYQIRIALTELAAETELIASPQERPFHSQFAFVAKQMPLRRCVREINGTQRRAPQNIQLLTGAILISRFLRRNTEASREYVGILLPNSVVAVMTLLGIQYADRTPAVLNFTASQESIKESIRKAQLKVVFTSRTFLDKIKMEKTSEMVFVEDVFPRFSSRLRRYFWLGASILLPHKELMKLISPESWNDVERIAVVIFSSGSTGIPKGIMLTHHNITADTSAVIRSIGWSKKDRILGNLPLFHSFGMAVCLWMPLSTGAEVVMVPNALDATATAAALRERKLTILFGTPAFLQIYMRRCQAEDFKTLRLVIAGAEKLRDDIADRFYKLTGLMIAEGYGCTELSPIVSVNLANSRMELGVEVAQRGSVGQPISGVCVKIVDPSTFELLPENCDGLLIVKGANVMKGYLDDPEKTAEVIRDGWYVTGDIAKMNRNGFITLTGRLFRFSKIGGEMVPHELVEREINNILQPEGRLIAVCGGPDKERGEKLIVFYTEAELLAPEQLVRKLRERKIPNLWIPRVENFVLVEQLPLLGSGKLDLTALSKMADKLCLEL